MTSRTCGGVSRRRELASRIRRGYLPSPANRGGQLPMITPLDGKLKWILCGLEHIIPHPIHQADDEEEMMAAYKIKDVACDDLSRGVLIGTVELYDCDGGEWYLRKPERAKTLRKPKRQPTPVWFNPF